MTWTRERPTQPGWYWWRTYGWDTKEVRTEVVSVEQLIQDGKPAYWYWEIGETEPTMIGTESSIPDEWYGPLEVPEGEEKP